MRKKRRFQGALHLHTTHSHDGTMSIEELAAFLRHKKYDYIAITEHSYDIDGAAMKVLEGNAQALSTPDFLIIPGIEFRCHYDIDILGFGVTQTTEHEEPGRVIDHIHEYGGVAVWAHPYKEKYVIDESWVKKLDGSEIYNTGNEGKLLPQMKTIRKFRQLSAWNPNLKAFTGLDLHRKKGFMQLSTEVFCENNNREEILAALRDGRFRSRSLVFNVDSSGKIKPYYLAFMAILRNLLNGVRWLRDLKGK